MKIVVLAALAFAIACVVAGVILVTRPAKQTNPAPTQVATRGPKPSRDAEAARLLTPPEEASPMPAPIAAAEPPRPVPSSTPSAEPAKATAMAPRAAAPANRGGRPGKEPLHDPLAREALAFVGADPAATEYWYAAINDPDLPNSERQDLIEDLNEDGLSDPKHPTPDDLPLILTRIKLIEAVWPTAPDQVALDACAEVYRDLVNLAGVALGSGEPVR
jgi:type IV secretory pathway VirB10-like protein